MSELQGLQLSMDEIRRRGARVIAVVVDPVATNAELARAAGLEFPILSDPDLRTTDAYGLRHREAHDGHDIARSASILIDASGTVRWTHVATNVRMRPSPAVILAAIDSIAPASWRTSRGPPRWRWNYVSADEAGAKPLQI